jgi:hypothetical protein
MRALTATSFLAGFLAAATVGCVTERSFERAVEDANYCETAEECVELYPGCPLGCVVLVNEAEEADIQKMIDRYDRQHRDTCIYDCAGLGAIRCENERCVAEPEP